MTCDNCSSRIYNTVTSLKINPPTSLYLYQFRDKFSAAKESARRFIVFSRHIELEGYISSACREFTHIRKWKISQTISLLPRGKKRYAKVRKVSVNFAPSFSNIFYMGKIHNL
jgi:hypothetical protein